MWPVANQSALLDLLPAFGSTADPRVTPAADGYYYFTATVPEYDRIELRRAHALNELGAAQPKVENAAADPLEGVWVERGQLKTGWESFTLDATVFALKGQRYLAWAQRPPSMGKHSTPEYAWEKVKFDVNEAPAVLVKNGRVFMTYSASAIDAH